MKFKTVRSKFVGALGNLKSVIKAGDYLNPFMNVRIDSLGDAGVRLTATDGNVQIESTVYCDVNEQGTVCVNADRLLAFCTVFPEGPIEATETESRLVLDVGSATFRIATGEVALFPEMHRPGADATHFHVPAMTLAEMLRKSVYAASKDDTRKLLKGVNLAVKSGMFSLTGMDGRRLATVEHEIDSPTDCDIIVSTQTAKTVHALCLAQKDGDVTIETDGKTVFVRGETWCITSKLVADAYPAWRKAVPSDEMVHTRIEIDCTLFMNGLATAGKSVGKEGGVYVEFKQNLVTFTAQSAFSSGKAVMPVKYDGPAIKKRARMDLRNEGTLYPPTHGGRDAFMARTEALEREGDRLERNARRRHRRAELRRQRLEDAKALERYREEARRSAKTLAKRIPEIARFQASADRVAKLSLPGATVVLAKSQEELLTEGRKMGNCVGCGTYGRGILHGDTLIVMVRDEQGRPWCDIEIARKGWEVRQCYAKHNARAPKEVHELAQALALTFKKTFNANKRRKSA